ncbi:MAG: HAD-IIIA family hydrolase [Betaproteobacteria bacterium]|nr:MAG: HAD-IIIA family hydrolase [Betaproteobacteria bacterium]
MNYSLIIFDWDGTLADSTAVIKRALQRAAEDTGYPIPTDEQASFIIGMGLKPALEYAVPTLRDEDLPKLTERFRHHFLVGEEEIVLFDGVPEMLASLKARGHWLAVATGKSRRGLDRAFDTLGLREFFVTSRCADEGFAKPHPGMLHAIYDTTGLTAKDSIMIGDTTHDLQLAENAGSASIGVTYGAHEPHLLRQHTPLTLVDSVSELATFLKANA